MNEITTIDALNEIIQNTEKLTILDFAAPWCGPCRAISPILEELSDERSDIEVVKINVDEASDLSTSYGIRNVPTLIFIKNGEQVDRSVGAVTKAALTSKIDELINT